MTKESVTLVGSGISSPDSKFSDLTFDCSVAGANLTLKDIWINNNVGRGTASGDVNFGLNIINFTGKGNQLNVEGESLLETQEYVQGAGISAARAPCICTNILRARASGATAMKPAEPSRLEERTYLSKAPRPDLW